MKPAGIIAFFSIIIIIHSSFFAVSQEKIPLDHSVYDSWKDLKNPVICNDGSRIAFEINPQKGDGNLILFSVDNRKYDTIPRGSKAAITPGADVLVFRIKPQFDTVRKAKLKKVKKDKLPKDSLGIMIITDKKIIKFPRLKKIMVPEKESSWLAFMLEKPKPKKQANDTTKVKRAKKNKKNKKKKKNYELLVFSPVAGDSVRFEGVTHFDFSKNGRACAMIIARGDSIDSVFVQVYDTKKQKLIPVLRKEGYSENISLDESGAQLAFTYSADTAKTKAFTLYYFNIDKQNLVSVSGEDNSRLQDGWSVSKDGKIFFNKKGDELYFGTRPRPVPEPKDTLTGDEKVSLDIWTWHDDLLQPQQLKQLDREKKRSYAAVYFPKDKKLVQLAGPDMEVVKTDSKAEGKYSLGYDDKPYRKMISWDASRYKDIYLVNRKTGERKMILRKAASLTSLSPQQNYVAWYNIADSSWNVYSIASGTSKNVTKSQGVNFFNEWNDVPNQAHPYGLAGWTKDEKLVIYDMYDLWKIDPSGKNEPENITKGAGRKMKIRFRYSKLDPDEKNLPDIMLLSAFNDKNKDAGFYSLNLKNNDLKQLVMDKAWFSRPVKAKKADRLIWRKESFVDFPDLYTSDPKFRDAIKISDANPQQSKYIWGTTDLVEWVSFDGDSVQGIFIKPENFDPSEKYPMLVYFYERSSQRLNRYYVPKPIRSVINWTYYASNGYLIFVPDIKYKTGYPGPSAFNYIISGTQSMCDRFPFIDRSRLGIQGQSWGGYETAYVVTQTNMFRAAMAGAPVSNMTSAYGGIRWGSGLSRAFQYEDSQSRIGGTLWEKLPLYILNSPVFFADRIETPLLIMHNDNDGAVPWYQGIEFFVALRRLNKPVWMLVYNKAPHNLSRRADMEDLTRRMQQFFDFYLKGAPEPSWMKYGVPAINKGRDFGFSLTNDR
ncbi:MAG: S9 family peptidase [Chlorobi bacterium]|nr:S9 family peptidase [Chlorobiota bacterium]